MVTKAKTPVKAPVKKAPPKTEAKEVATKASPSKKAQPKKEIEMKLITVPEVFVPQTFRLHVMPIVTFNVIGGDDLEFKERALMEDGKKLNFSQPLFYDKEDNTQIGVARPALEWAFKLCSSFQNSAQLTVVAPQDQANTYLAKFWKDAVGNDTVLHKIGATVSFDVPEVQANGVEKTTVSEVPVIEMPISKVVTHQTWVSPLILPADTDSTSPTMIGMLNIAIQLKTIRFERAVKMVRRYMEKTGISQCLVNVVVHSSSFRNDGMEIIKELLEREEVESYTVDRLRNSGIDSESPMSDDMVWIPSPKEVATTLLPETALFAHIVNLTFSVID